MSGKKRIIFLNYNTYTNESIEFSKSFEHVDSAAYVQQFVTAPLDNFPMIAYD